MMHTRFVLPGFASLMVGAALLLSACGGGTGDSGTTTVSSTGPAGPNNFLLFPNPLKQLVDDSLQVNSVAYSTAYYAAIDPNGDRANLGKFKATNHIGDPTGPTEKEVTIIIGDQRDLGYGRKMTGRMNADGSIAFVVDNYLVGGYGTYSPLSVEAAVRGESHWFGGTNGIEFSPVAPAEAGAGKPNTSTNGKYFVKFYTFSPVTGERLLAANLDGRGDKAMPTICISCHGGRGDPLTPTGLFPKLTFSESGARGDVSGQTHAFEPNAFDFSTVSGFTRSALEANIKELNKMVLCTYPKTAADTSPEDTCRRAANPNEYQGTAAAHLKHMYGGIGLPDAAAESTDTYYPGDWATSGQTSLYSAAVNNACRVCHSLRGTGNQSDIDFQSFSKFNGYADRIKAHVIDRGNMPLVALIYNKYWTTPSMNGAIATYLAGDPDANAKPGRPVADPGPDRVIKAASTTLSAAMSLYASTYQWSVTSGAATLTNPTSATPTFSVNAPPGAGSYTVQLVVGNGTTNSTAKTQTIVVDPALTWDPASVSFNNTVVGILQSGGGGCITCHTSTPATALIPPMFYDDYDRSGTGIASSNRTWMYTELLGRINFTDIVASPLLRKPSGEHHNGGPRPGFDTSTAPGNAARADYDKLVAWILRGAPEN